MAIKSVVGHDSSEIWVSNEEDTEQIVDLSLIPVCSIVQTRNAGDWRCLVGVCLDTNSGVVAHAQEVVDNFESLVSGGKINSSDVGDLGELCGGII
jgi:hypothetical protein